jgi:hypothetical protein
MAVKKMEVVVCDFPHKHDRPAVAQVTIDVCHVHDQMFADVSTPKVVCRECGGEFTEKGLTRHFNSKHKGKKRMRAVS